MEIKKPKVSVVIVTYNRPQFISRAIQSALNQTYQDFEIIVVDNGMEQPAENIVKSFNDKRIRYIQNNKNTGCSGGKNIGIKNARGEFIAFLDDDDIWLPEKLEIQMKKFKNAPKDAGFCFAAVIDILDNQEKAGGAPNAMANYYERALKKFNGFLACTLVIKRSVFNQVGVFDEKLPSHTDIDLVIRIAKKYKGIGINKPLAKMTRLSSHQQMGSSYKRRIRGREMLLAKYHSEFKKRPKALAKHLFKLGTFYRKDGQFLGAKKVFKKTWLTHFKIRYFLHYLSMFFNGKIYKLLIRFK